MAKQSVLKPVISAGIVTGLAEMLPGESFVLRGNGTTEPGKIVLNNPSNTFSTTIQSGTTTQNITFVLPSSDGTASQALQTDGSGNLSFTNLVTTGGSSVNLSDDTTPALGGDLIVDGYDITSTSNQNIVLDPNGTGEVLFDGDGTSGGVTISDGIVDIKNSGSVSSVKLYCESSNLHYTEIQSALHSEYASGNVTLTLPPTSGRLLLKTEAESYIVGASFTGVTFIFII